MPKIQIDIKNSSSLDLVLFFNKYSGQKPIKKFSDRASAEKRVSELVQAHNELAGFSSKPTKKAVLEKAPKANAEKTSVPKKPVSLADFAKKRRGRPPAAAGKKIYLAPEFKIKGSNPHHGSDARASFDLIKDGMSYEDFLAAGGENWVLMYDHKKGRVSIR